MDNFDKDQINKAINKFQEEHPQMVWHDVTRIKDVEYIDTISSQIEIIARKLQEDTDMYIVCEMAKKYLEGARPVYPVKQEGEWIFDSEYTEFGNPYGIYRCNKCGGHSSNKYPFCFWCGAEMKRSEEE